MNARSLISHTLIFLISSVCALSQVSPDTAHFWRSPRWFAGVRVNNSLPYGTIGFLAYPKPAWAIATSVDLGGNQTAASSLLFYAILRDPTIHIYIVIGPNLEDLDANPDYENPTTILTLATGLAARVKVTNILDFHFSASYLTPSGPPKPFKLAFALSVPFAS